MKHWQVVVLDVKQYVALPVQLIAEPDVPLGVQITVEVVVQPHALRRA